jgi:hypothetical protein
MLSLGSEGRELRHLMWNSPNKLTICCIVLKQDPHDKLGEPARWVMYSTDFDKSTNQGMDKDRAEQWMNMYSILDRSTFEENCVRSDQGLAGRFPSRELSDRRSTDWIRGQCL